MKLALASSIALLILAACSKPTPEEQKKREDQLAAALASAMNAPAASPSAGAPAALPGAISATCNNKGDGVCTETMGAAGMGAENSCTILGGVYAKGPTPCPRENLVGTCAQIDATSGLNDLRYYYKGGASTADLKTSCESIMSGAWAAAPPKATAQAASKPAAPTKPKK